MFELIVDDIFSAAHQLNGYDGPCENIHGHNWKVQIVVGGKELDNKGLLVDFKNLKTFLQEELSKYDHKFLNEVLKVNPTSENIAKIIFNNIKQELPAQVKLSKVFVWESEDAGVSYSEEA